MTFHLPSTKIYRLCPDSDNAFCDDDDIRQSTLDLSDNSTSDSEPMDHTRRDEIKTYWNKKYFHDQETPDPLISKVKDVRPKHPIHDRPTELEQNWTTDKIIESLPKQTNITSIRTELIGFIIYRSTSDKTTIPDIIDAAYLQNGLTRSEHGLKFSTKHTDITTIHQLLITRQIPVTADNFFTIFNTEYSYYQEDTYNIKTLQHNVKLWTNKIHELISRIY